MAGPRKGPEERPLNRQELAFATWFCRFRDIYKAAEKAKIPKTQAGKLFNRIEIQEEIERQQDVHRQECARQLVAAENLNNELLDRELVLLIRAHREKTPTVAREAIQLGYIALGRIQAGTTRVLEQIGAGDAAGSGQVGFYQAFVPVGMPVGMPVDVAPAPILPEEPAEPSAVSSQPSVERTAPVREPYRPPGQRSAISPQPSVEKPAQPVTPPAPAAPPARKAGKLKIG
jgi:hypothetical protein